MVFHVRRDGTYVDFHQGLGAKPLVPPEQFLGRRMADVLPADVAREGMAFIARALDEGAMQVWRYEVAGRSYEARIVAGGADEVVSFVRDITA
jgi:hypothetical protein